MPMTAIPRYKEWLLLTSTIENRREDSVMKYLDSLIQHLERSRVSYNFYLTLCDLFFTTDYWLRANPRYSPAHASDEDLYRFVVRRLCEIFHCTVNVLPRELELMFGRGMSAEGFKTDILQGRARDATKEELGQYRVVFKQGKLWQFPHWEAHPTALLKLVDSIHIYDPKSGLRRHEGDNYHKGNAFFVMTMGRELFLRKHATGGAQRHNGIYHSNYTGGGAVLCAGSMLVEGGIIKYVRSDSGHYQPQETNMVSLLLALQMHGIDIRDIQVVDFTGTQAAMATEFIQASGDWTLFVDAHDFAPMNEGCAFSMLQSGLARADQNGGGRIAPDIPRVNGNYTGKYVGNKPALPPNFARTPQAPPRPPRPTHLHPHAQQWHMRMVNGVMRSGRPLPPLPGQRPGPTVRLARNSSMNDVNLYQNQ